MTGELMTKDRIVRKRVEMPYGERGMVVYEPGDMLHLVGSRDELWLVDVMAIAGPTGQMRRVHEKCLALAPFHMLHSEACQEPESWQ